MTPVDSTTGGLGRGPRAFVLLLGVVVAVHSALVAAWLAPPSPVRDSIGSSRLATYVDPYFQQGADTVGIGSNRVDEALQVRAYVRTSQDGEPRVTDWIDITERDLDATRGSVAVDRALTAARRIAVSVNAAVVALAPPQRRVAIATTRDETQAQVRAQLLRAGDDDPVEPYLSTDEMVRQFASLWLGADLPDVEILAVGYRVGIRQVPDRGDQTATLSGREFSWTPLGWRRPFRGTPEARAAFERLVADE